MVNALQWWSACYVKVSNESRSQKGTFLACGKWVQSPGCDHSLRLGVSSISALQGTQEGASLVLNSVCRAGIYTAEQVLMWCFPRQ